MPPAHTVTNGFENLGSPFSKYKNLMSRLTKLEKYSKFQQRNQLFSCHHSSCYAKENRKTFYQALVLVCNKL